MSSTETNDTSAESPWSQLWFDTLKMGVALSRGRHTCSPRKARVRVGKKNVFLGHEGVAAHFQGVKIKLTSRASFWYIICFITSNINTIYINLNLFPDIAFTPCKGYHVDPSQLLSLLQLTSWAVCWLWLPQVVDRNFIHNNHATILVLVSYESSNSY